MINPAKESFNFFYLCLFTITVLFLSAFAFKLHQINLNVLGLKMENTITDAEIAKQVNFWNGFITQNPQYFEGYMELFNLTGNTSYLNKAKEIDPNR